ncbi:MAG TPA: Uma2 family endonuclease [Anaerolineae bacterium]|nr:Uma2 family endonuclease [Anaerolineae bacterium]
MSVRTKTATLDVEPAWDIAKIFPAQGTWAEEDYLLLPGNRLVEYSHGVVEVLSMPSYAHQLVVALLFETLKAFVRRHGLGVVVFAPMRLKLWNGKYREPDLLFMLQRNRHRIHQQYWDGADLVMEVVSPDDPMRDLETKRREYAQAGIPEYWLVNPIDETITVFTLPENASIYAVHGVYDRRSVAESVLLPGLIVDVDACFAEGEQ